MSPEVEAAALSLIRGRIPTGPIISSYDVVVDYLRALIDRPFEHFHILYLDTKNRLIADETLSRGTINHVSVYPREVARACLLNNAAAVILAHNHPSGDPEPSKTDIEMTKKVARALGTIEVTLHDHLIIGNPGTFSFRASGKL